MGQARYNMFRIQTLCQQPQADVDYETGIVSVVIYAWLWQVLYVILCGHVIIDDGDMPVNK